VKRIRNKIARIVDRLVRKTETFKTVDAELKQRLLEVEELNRRVAELDRELLTNYSEIASLMFDVETFTRYDTMPTTMRVILDYDMRTFDYMLNNKADIHIAAVYIGRLVGSATEKQVREAMSPNRARKTDGDGWYTRSSDNHDRGWSPAMFDGVTFTKDCVL